MTVPQPSPGETLAEAFAWWSIGVGRDRRSLSDAAAQALLDGLDSAALRELAGIGLDDNPFEVDDLIARTVDELSLGPLVDRGPDLLVARKLSRSLFAGDVRERDLTRWAHGRFHHESEVDAFNRLAELDDDLDAIGASDRRRSDVLRRIRSEAARLLDMP